MKVFAIRMLNNPVFLMSLLLVLLYLGLEVF